MNLWVSTRAAIAAFGVAGALSGAQSLAQNAYITNGSFSNNNVSVINTVTNAVIATIPVGANPYSVAVTADGSKVYVADSFGSVAVIDTATDTVTDDPGRRQSLRRGGDPGRKQGLCYE